MRRKRVLVLWVCVVVLGGCFGEEVPLYPPPPCRTVWVEGPPEEIHLAVGEETTFVASLAAIYVARLNVDAPGDIVDVTWEVVVPGSFRIAIVGLKGGRTEVVFTASPYAGCPPR